MGMQSTILKPECVWKVNLLSFYSEKDELRAEGQPARMKPTANHIFLFTLKVIS